MADQRDRCADLRVALLTLLLLVLGATRPASAETLWGLTTQNTLVRFTSTAPSVIELTLPITGLPEGERLVAITIFQGDGIYGGNGTFFGLGSSGRLYTADRTTGAMTPFAAQSGRIYTPRGMAFGMHLHTVRSGNDWTFDVVSDAGQRIRMPLSGNLGQVLQFPFPASAHVVGIAGDHGAALAVDAHSDRLYGLSYQDVAGPPSLIDIGPLGVDISDQAGLATSIYGTTYAAFTVGGVPGLYRIPNAGPAIPVGSIGSAPIISLAADREALVVVVPQPWVRSNTIELLEGTGTTALLRRTGDFTAPVDYLVTNRSTAGLVVSHSRVHFAAGERERTITLNLIDDDVREGSETMGVLLREDRPVAPFTTGLGIEAIDNDNQPPVLTLSTPSTPAVFALADTMTISGFVTDDRPGTVVTLATAWEAPSSLGTSTTNPWVFENIPTTAFYSDWLRVIARDAEGASSTIQLRVQRGTTQTLTLAEGATGSFFDTELLFANPAALDVAATIDFLRQDGTTVRHTLAVPARQRVTLDVGSVPGLEATASAAIVTAVGSIAVERTMRWDASGYGAATERASPATSTTWHFAEGSQGFFDTFLLLVNPQATTNEATVRFLRASGGPITRTYTLAARTRLTIAAANIPELVNQSFGIEVAFAQPAAAERSMYFGPAWAAGHASAGATAPATEWLLAEGATGTFFETFVLAANPSNQPADVTFTFLPESGVPVSRTKQIPANSRVTVNIEQEDPALAHGAVSTRVTSSVPIVVERSQYWPFTPDRWYEAHNSVGQTAAAPVWTLAEGRSGGPDGYQTFILLMNPHPSQATNASIRFLREDGDDVVHSRNVAIPAASRVTVATDPSQFPELTDSRFGAVITTFGGPPIVVERSMYASPNGQFWGAGTNAPATLWPF